MPIFNSPYYEIDKKETKRYAGLRNSDFDEGKIEEACELARLIIKPTGIWEIYDYDSKTQTVATIPPFKLHGNAIGNHLNGCSKVILLAATVGIDIENEITSLFKEGKYSLSLMLDAAATTAVEQNADLMEKAIKEAEIKKRKQEELKRAAQQRELEAQRKLEEEQIKRLREGKSEGFEGQENIKETRTDEPTYDIIKAQPLKQATPIHAASGQFIRPVRGEIITSYGQELSKGVNSKGIVFKTRDNAQVVAPYDGTVVFSGPFKGYGNLIIISHDDDVVSLIAGMKSIDTENGQMLLAGEPVGLMPDNGLAKLYMEIRKNKKPINPLPWLGQ